MKKYKSMFKIEEVKIKLSKDSIMFGGRPSSELQISPDKISLWINGGSAYRFNFDGLTREQIIELQHNHNLRKIGEEIASSVAKFLEKELKNKLEKIIK